MHMFNHFTKNKIHLAVAVALAGATIGVISGNAMHTLSNNAYATNVAKHSSQISDDQRLTPHTIDNMKYIAPVNPAPEEKPAAEVQDQAQTQAPAAQAQAPQAPTVAQSDTSTAPTAPQPATTAPANTPAPAAQAPQAPQQRTDGFNLNGSHFDLANYADTTGKEVPQWTPYIYRYTVLPNYYLAEGQSNAGAVARAAGVGSTLILNGQTLHMTSVIYVNRLDPNAFEAMRQVGSQNRAVLQTCTDATGNNLKIAIFN